MLRTGSWIAAAAAALMSLGGPAEGAWMIPPAPYWAKDFAIVKKDGVYHLFYIERNTTLPQSQTERDFGHAVSYDLLHWSQAPPVLAVRDSSWDNFHVWAPSIVEHNGIYTMFYAGVTQESGVYRLYQRIGIATSTDLYNWTREDQPLFSCHQVPWAFCDSLNALTSFRDPYVMPDPANPGRWLMYYTASAAGDSLNELVGVASSDSTLTNWTDLKPLWNTFHTYTGTGLAESPHVFQHDGLWYLFYTTNGAQPIVMVTSPDPTADPEGWTPRGRLGDMLGLNAGSWFASEHFQDGLNEYLAYINGDRVELYQMMWDGVATFHLQQPDPFHVTGMTWEADTVRAGTTTQLKIASVNWFTRHANIEAVAIDSLGNETLVPTDSLGLASMIPISNDTLHWAWTARVWPSGRSDPMRLRVRLTDQTAMTPIPIVVLPDTGNIPNPFRPLSISWSRDTVTRGSAVMLEVAAISGAQHSVGLVAYTRDDEGGLFAAPLDSLGLPSTLPLVADTTRFTWTSRTWPDSVDGPSLTRLVVGIANDTLETRPFLVVLPDTVPPDSFRVLSIAWSADSVARGAPVELEVAAIHGAQHMVALEAFTRDDGGNFVAAPLDSLGLPPALSLVADTTRFTWTSRTWPDSINGPRPTRIVVRIANNSLETLPWLVVVPDLASAPGPRWPPGSPGAPDQVGELIRVLSRGATESGTSFAIHTTSASAARVELFDVQGRRAAVPLDGAVRRGWTVVSWDGRREDGARAGPGIYFARLTTPRGRHTARVVLLP